MSQIQTSQKENFISLVRISLGPSSPVLWDENDSSQTWIRRGVDVVLVDDPKKTVLSETEINSARLKAINRCETEWIWLVDADVIPANEFYVSLRKIIEGNKTRKFIGAEYESIPSQSLWEKSYNRMCNLWSESHQIPLAGNMILHKSLVPAIQDLKDCAFGTEEYYLKRVSSERGHQTRILKLKLVHKNGKNLKTLFATCRDQAHQSKPAVPLRRYISLLLRSFPKAPLQTAVVTIYLITNAFLSLLSPKSKSH